MQRKCDVCDSEYNADERNIKRGWGLCCSKSCAAKKREMSRPGYNAAKVDFNNFRRANWISGPHSRKTSEGYSIRDGVAYNEFDEPMYNIEEHIFSDDAFNEKY